MLDNLVRGRRENLADAFAAGGERVALVEGDIADVDLVRKQTVGQDVVFHLAALRITQCAEEPAPGAGVAGRRHVQRDRGRGRRRGAAR